MIDGVVNRVSDYVTYDNIKSGLSTVYKSLDGFITGYTFYVIKKAVDTIEQGANYYLAAALKTAEVGLAITQLMRVIPMSRICFVVSTIALPLIAGVGIAFSSAYKQGNYDTFVSGVNMYIGYVGICPFFSSDVGYIKGRIFIWIAEYSNIAAQVVMAVSTLALLILGNYVTVISTLVVIGINVLDEYVLSQRLSVLFGRGTRFFSYIIPTIVSIGSIVTGSFYVKCYGIFKTAFLVSFVFSKRITGYITNKLDNKVMNWLAKYGMEYPSLEEVDTSKIFVQSPKLNCNEICDILYKTERRLPINPKHVRLSSLINTNVGDVRYDELNEFFKQVDWLGEGNFDALAKKFLKDERIIDIVLTKEQERVKSDYKQKVVQWVKKNVNWISDSIINVAKIIWQNKSLRPANAPENLFFPSYEYDLFFNYNEIAEFASNIDWFNDRYFHYLHFALYEDNLGFRNWVSKLNEYDLWKNLIVDLSKKQIQLFVNNISGKKRPKGSMDGYEDVQKKCKIIIKYLRGIKASEKVLFVDSLIRFIVEGGDYCVQGLERAVKANYETVLAHDNSGMVSLNERILFSLLQKRRARFDQGYYIALNYNEVDSNVIQNFFNPSDIHVYNIFQHSYIYGLGIEQGDALDATIDDDTAVPKFLMSLLPYARIAFWHGYKPNNLNFSKRAVSEKLNMLKSMINKLPSGNDTFISPISRIKKVFLWIQIFIFEVLYMIMEEDIERYDEKLVINTIKEMIRNKQITYNEYVNWFKEYYRDSRGFREYLSIADETDVEEEINKAIIKWDEIITNTPKSDPTTGAIVPKSSCIRLMLVEMGILEKNT